MKKYKRIVDNKMKGFGQTDLANKVIKINKKKNKKQGRGELIDSIVHEELHAKHPMAYERTIRKKTQKAIMSMRKSMKDKYYSRYR